MTLQEFATRYHLRIRKDSCGDEIIAGRRTDKKSKIDRLEDHHHVYQVDGSDDGRLFLFLNFPTKTRYTYAKKALLALNFKLRSDGETDGIIAFDPENIAQVKLLIKLAGLRVKRQLTEEQRERLKTRFAKKEQHAPAQL